MKNKLLSGLVAILLFSGNSVHAEKLRERTYIVQKGDTLYEIAENQGLDLNELIDLNPGIRPKLIQIGQKINLPEPKKEYNSHLMASDRIVDFIKEQEKFKARKYTDGRRYAIGYGHNFRPGEWYEEIDKKTGESLLMRDIREAEKLIKSKIRVELKPQEFDALVSIFYNLGHRSDIVSEINKNNLETAIKI